MNHRAPRITNAASGFMSSNSGAHIAALLTYTLLAVVATFPLVGHLSTHLLTIPGELGQDVWQNVWNVWWVFRALLVEHTNPYTTDMLFYPQGTSLYLHSLDLPVGLMGLVLLPVLGVVSTYNLLTIAVLMLSGYCSFLLVRHVVGNTPAALVAGAIVLCAPQRLNEVRIAQLHTFTDFGVHLALLAMFVALERRTWRWSLLVAGLLLLAGLSSWYHLFHASLVLAIMVLWRAVGAWREGKQPALVRELVPWGRVVLLSGALIAPFLLPAIAESVLAPYAWKSDDLVFSASLDQLVPHFGGFWQTVPVDWLHDSLFGFVPVVLALAGAVVLHQKRLFHRRDAENAESLTTKSAKRAGRETEGGCFYRTRKPRRVDLPLKGQENEGIPPPRLQTGLWATIALVCLVLSPGPRLVIGETDTGIPLPYALFRVLPVLDTFRAPVRLNAIVNLALGIFAAGGLAYLFRRLSSVGGWVVSLLLIVLIAGEAVRLPVPLVSAAVSPFYEQVAEKPGQWSLMEFPLDRFDLGLLEMYTQTIHGKYILAGLVSRSVPSLPYEDAPPIERAHAGDTRPDIVAMSHAERDQLLRALRVRYLVVRPDATNAGLAREQVAAARQTLGPLTEVYSDTVLRAYRLDEVAAWLDGPGRTTTEEVPLLLGRNGEWDDLERGWFGYARWLPREGAGFWAYTERPRRVVLELALYALPPGEQPLEVWLNGRHIQTLQVADGRKIRRYTTSPFNLPVGTNLIELHAPRGGVRPRDLGLSNDSRVLSLSIHHAALREVRP